jgi:hypothetical protein
VLTVGDTQVDATEATALVGLLFENRNRYSGRSFRASASILLPLIAISQTEDLWWTSSGADAIDVKGS